MKTLILLIAAVALLHSAPNFPTYKPPSSKPVAVGDEAPDFTLNSHGGDRVSLSAARGNSPVVLVFYRGFW